MLTTCKKRGQFDFRIGNCAKIGRNLSSLPAAAEERGYLLDRGSLALHSAQSSFVGFCENSLSILINFRSAGQIFFRLKLTPCPARVTESWTWLKAALRDNRHARPNRSSVLSATPDIHPRFAGLVAASRLAFTNCGSQRQLDEKRPFRASAAEPLSARQTRVVSNKGRYHSPALTIMKSTPHSQLRIVGRCLRMLSFHLIS